MIFPFKWVPEEPYRRFAAQLFSLEMDPAVIQPAISVQRQWNRCLGIIRGKQEHGLLIEDHIREQLDEQGLLCETSGERIFGADAMRRQVWTTQEHITNYIMNHPGHELAAWAGNGNLLCNPYFVAYLAAEARLFHLQSEISNFRQRRYAYTCLVVYKPGIKPGVGIEELYFGYQGDKARVYSQAGKDMTDSIACALSGQSLVEEGACLTKAKLITQALYSQYYDLRHLFLFGRINVGRGRWLDAGLAAFWDEHGVINQSVLEKALMGEAITLDCTRFPVTELEPALAHKGYKPVSVPALPGDYTIKNGKLTIVFLEGIYPHSMLGVRRDGRVFLVVLKGLGNRVGVTIQGAAQIMQLLGACRALLIDNGGDVMLHYRNKAVLQSSESRDRLRSLLLFETTKKLTQLTRSDIDLTIYPAVKGS